MGNKIILTAFNIYLAGVLLFLNYSHVHAEFSAQHAYAIFPPAIDAKTARLVGNDCTEFQTSTEKPPSFLIDKNFLYAFTFRLCKN